MIGLPFALKNILIIGISIFLLSSSVFAQNNCDSFRYGDANCDKQINSVDYVIWSSHYLDSAKEASAADFNTDAKVSLIDLEIFIRNIGRTFLEPSISPTPIGNSPTQIPTGTAGTSYSVTVLPLSANELKNVGRGLYNWQGQKYIINPALISDTSIYRRFSWRDLEPTEGQYDFAKIDDFIRTAQTNNQQVIIGLVQPIKASSNGILAMPDYLTTPVSNPGYDSTVKGTYGTWWKGTYWPDFNNEYIKQRFEAIIKAFGDRYDKNPNIAFIQMMHYGAYGEYYVPWDAPESVSKITNSNAKFTIDIFRKYFPSQNFSALLSNSHGGFMTRNAIVYENVGWSRAALGHEEQMKNIDELMNDPQIGQIVADKWKTAPIWTEMIGQYTMTSEISAAQFENAKNQVTKYHISYVGNGNFRAPYDVKPYNSDGTRNTASIWTQQQIDDFVEAGKRSGYRYAIQKVTLDKGMERGNATNITIEWLNNGVAPIYKEVTVMMQLRNNANVVVWEQRSTVDLKKVLPTNGVPFIHVDTATIPTTVPAGTYKLQYLSKQGTFVIHLANPENADGSVEIGSVEVR